MVIVGHWRNTPYSRFFSELKLLVAGRTPGLAFLQNTLGVGGLAVCEGRRLEGGESTLVETSVPSGWADG